MAGLLLQLPVGSRIVIGSLSLHLTRVLGVRRLLVILHFYACPSNHIGQLKSFIDTLIRLSILRATVAKLVGRGLGAHLADVHVSAHRGHLRSLRHDRSVVLAPSSSTRGASRLLPRLASILEAADPGQVERLHRLVSVRAHILEWHDAVIAHTNLHVSLLRACGRPRSA